MKAQRPQLQTSDVAETESLRRTLNDIFLDLSTRLETLEAVKGVTVLPEVYFETGGTVAPSVAPFAFNVGVRLTCPFSPTGLVLLRLENVGSQAVSALPSDVKWHFAAGPAGGAGDGVLHIDFVTGLAINSRYKLRVGVTRA